MRHSCHFLTGATLVLFALAACGSSAADTTGAGASRTATSVPPTGVSTTVNLAMAAVKGTQTQILTAANGMTLYVFTPDTATTPACTGGCATTWPPLLLQTGKPVAPQGLTGTLTVFNDAARPQIQYNGHFLYAYSGDKQVGDTNGEGIGGKWHVATPAISSSADYGAGY